MLLTGITGFVGSLVLEQLLRTCPDVHKVYVIARTKHSVSGPERVQQMLHSHPLFHLVRAQINNSAPSQLDEVTASHQAFSEGHSDLSKGFPRVEVLAGDMTLPGYGIGKCEMQRLKQETEIVVHAAASISFDDHIHDAITHNYLVGVTNCLLLLLHTPAPLSPSFLPFSLCVLMPRILFILQLPWPAVHACPVLCKCLLTTTTHHLVHACAVVAVNSADTVTCKINLKSCIAFLWNRQPLINALDAADMWTHMTSFIVVFLTECANWQNRFCICFQDATSNCPV